MSEDLKVMFGFLALVAMVAVCVTVGLMYGAALKNERCLVVAESNASDSIIKEVCNEDS